MLFRNRRQVLVLHAVAPSPLREAGVPRLGSNRSLKNVGIKSLINSDLAFGFHSTYNPAQQRCPEFCPTLVLVRNAIHWRSSLMTQSSSRRFANILAVNSELRLAANEDEIKALLEQPELHAILFNLDSIGDGPSDSLDVLEEIRKIRDDVVLAAFTRSNQRTIPLKASQAGADEFFRFPINYDELKIVLCRAIEKRALELEGRRLLQQVEDKAVFCGLVGLESGHAEGVSSHAGRSQHWRFRGSSRRKRHWEGTGRQSHC